MPVTSADISGQTGELTGEGAELLRTGLGSFFRPGDLESVGMTRDQLRGLVRRGVVEYLSRGLYRVVGADVTADYSIAMACARVPNSVVCLLSALRVHGIGTQTPAHVWLAVPHHARAPRVEGIRVRVVRFSGRAWSVGVIPAKFEGVSAHITNPARTIVDCFRLERLVGAEVAMEALQDGLRQRVATVAELARIESELPSRRLRAQLDARSI